MDAFGITLLVGLGLVAAGLPILVGLLTYASWQYDKEKYGAPAE